MTLLIDRSNNNSADDYAAAHKAGVTHAYFKATEGTSFVDSTYVSRRREAHAAGIVVGGYHFAQNSSPVAEADHFLANIGTPSAGHLRPCLDLESGESAAWAAAFVEHLHTKLGYWPALYGNTSTIPALRAASPSVRACPWWRAEFGPNDGGRHALQGGDMGASAHQYTSNAMVTGISGRTDASAFLDEAHMLVPAAVIKPKRPDHYLLHHTDKFGQRQVVNTKFPGLWQRRRPRAKWRGDILIHPVHK